MVALGLLASHLVGDFVFQTRWQAAGKLGDWRLRARHVLAYCLAFVWVLLLDVPAWRLAAFAAGLAVLHFLTDSRRFHSTFGDVVGWQGLDDAERRWAWEEYAVVEGDDWTKPEAVPESWQRWPTENPWPAIPLMIDQALHVAQVAALALLLT